MNIFGVKIEEYSQKDVLDKCLKILKNQKTKKPHWIITLNPEILLEARKNNFYKKIITLADFKIIDGIGIKIISWLKKKPSGDRITGVDLAEFLLKFSIKNKLKIGIVYNKKGLSSKKEILNSFKNFNKITLLGIDRKNTKKIVNLKFKKYHLVLVALGHPYQEKFIYNNLLNFKRTKLIIGVGGALDFWTKKQSRAPKIFQEFGLEWIWRLIKQPKRLVRIFKAVVFFPILALIDFKITSNSEKIK